MCRILLTLMLLLCMVPGVGQQISHASEQGKTVFVDYFTFASGIGYNRVACLRKGIMECMARTGRVRLKDAGSEAGLQVETRKRTSGAFWNDITVRERMLVRAGATYVVAGHVRTLDVAARRAPDGTAYYEVALAFALKVKNLSEGTVQLTRLFTYPGLTGCTPEAAIGQAVLRMAPEIDAFVRVNFKIEGSLLQVEKNVKGVPEDVYVNLGFAHGIRTGQYLDVYAGQLGGENGMRKNIGVLLVTDVLGDDMAVCKIKRGKKKIMKAFNLTQMIIPNRRFLFGRAVVR